MRASANFSMRRAIAATTIAIAAALHANSASASSSAESHAPRTPIKHLIVIVGENRTFDHLFATYAPAARQTVLNLRSEGIVKPDGTPGPNFIKAQQWQADDKDQYSIAPTRTLAFTTLPQPNTNHALGQPANTADARFPADLPNGPFQLSKYTPYQLSYIGDPVHRFFQMWQQFDQGRNDLFTWVGVTIGTGSNGQPQSSPFNSQSTHQGTPMDVKQHPFTLPPQTIPNIGEALSKAGISWKYYIGGHKGPNETWCSICNPLQFSKGVMTTDLRDNIKDVSDFYADVAKEDLPSISFVRPYEPYSGHPANSAVSADEYFVMSIANATIEHRRLFDDTAIAITFDEGGGYYDSGYIQTLDFFGDGTRTPLMIISPYVAAGHIDHTYYDHGSILKFIEANWSFPPMSSRSRDNFPNPVSKDNPYVPTNGPAIGDLMGMFDFKHKRKTTPLIIPGGI